MKRLTFALEESDLRKFDRIAKNEGLTMAQVLRGMVESFCDDTGALRDTA